MSPLHDQEHAPSREQLQDFFDILRDGAVVRAPPWMALVAALSAVRPRSIAATIDWLVANRAEIEGAFADAGARKLSISNLRPEFRYEPELGGLDRARNDHSLRGRYLFADLLGKRTFMQTVVLALTGIELSPSDAEMLDQVGVANVAVDQRAWPLAAARRVAGRGGGFAAAVVAGQAIMGSSIMGPESAACSARSMVAIQRRVAAGESVEAILDDYLARKERIMGYGRPVVGPDERSDVMESIARKYGRGDGVYVLLAREIERALVARKGLTSTAAAWVAAIMLDLGFSPVAVQALTSVYLSAALSAQAVYSGEIGVKREAGRP